MKSGTPSKNDTERTDEINRTIVEKFGEVTPITRALVRGARAAMLRHKRLGHPIFVWKDGRVVRIPPEEIPEPTFDDL